ncbi:MAG: hypothetical protein ACR2NF_03465, partial [Pirellulales bacterium]
MACGVGACWDRSGVIGLVSLQNTGALPTPVLSLNLVQRLGGSQPEMAKQLKALEKENARLKKMVAEQALDMEILKEAA